MVIIAFFQWWYGHGWAQQVKAIGSRTKALADMFSIGILLRTLFSPWKQIVSQSSSDQAVGIKMQAGVDNIVSRFVGFSVRSIVLCIALLLIVLTAFVSVIIAILWPILPSLALFVIPLGFAL